MAEEAPPSNDGAVFLMMEDILERLKMLDYEVCSRPSGARATPGPYFASPCVGPRRRCLSRLRTRS
jgi:hypothetical protein